MMHIDKETYKIKQINRYNSTPKKSQIIISFSLRKNNYHINRLLNKEYGKTKKWNTYSISRGGEIFEHYNPKYYSDYMGIKDVDKKSISVVLENMGSLIKDGINYINWLNENCPNNRVIYKNFLGEKHWEFFTANQFTSTATLCNDLCNKFNIPKKVIEFHHYNNNIKKFNGIVLKSNYFENTTNINPLFNLEKLNKMIQMFD